MTGLPKPPLVFALWYDYGVKLLLATFIVISAIVWLPALIVIAVIDTAYGHIVGVQSTYKRMRRL